MINTLGVSPPRLFRRHVPRARLTQMLDQVGARAIILNAPAGYGKTTLAAEWLQGRDQAWHRATVASADVAAFSLGLAHAASHLIAVGDGLRQRLGVREEPAETRALAQLLAEDLADWPTAAWLVIDDYQNLVESEAAEEFTDELITRSSLNVFITTRQRPEWASARRIASGEILELSRSQLAMTSSEAAAVLVDFEPRRAQEVIDRANGWPALIGLAGTTAAIDLPDSFMSETLYRYLAEEVVKHLPLDVQTFLLRASVPTRLDVAYAGTAFTPPQAKRILRALDQQGLVQRFGESLRLHPLLQEFLRSKLELEQPAEAAQLYQLAIERAMTAEDWDEAYELASRARSPGAISAIIHQAAPQLVALGRVETIEKWLRSLPLPYRATASIRLVRAEIALRRGEFSHALGLAEEVLLTSTTQRATAWLTAGRAAHLTADEAKALQYYAKARDAATTREERRDACWGALITAGVLELPEAETYLEELEKQSTDDVDARLLLAVGRETLAALTGSFSAVMPGINQTYFLSRHSQDPMIRTNALSSTGWLSLLGAEYLQARTIANEALQYCEKLRLSFATPFFLAIRGASEIGMRQLSRARATLGQMSRSPAWAEDPFLQTDFANLCTKLAITAGHGLTSGGGFPFLHGHRSVLGERYSYMALSEVGVGNWERARSLLEEATNTSRATIVVFASRWVSIVLRAASDEISESEIACEGAELLQESANAGCLDPFVYAYRCWPKLLPLIARDVEALKVIGPVMARTNDLNLAKAMGLSLADAGGQGTRMTPREEEVFALVREGASNSEIAARLFISQSTAKVHVRNIVKKLGVASRLEAATLRWPE